MNLSKLFTFLLFSFIVYLPNFSFGQCSIVSDSVVCLDDFLSFSVSSGGKQVASYSWQLGDGKTSNLADPIAQYSSFGIKNIEVTIQLKGGGSCKATKTIFVHDRPVASVKFSSQSSYCFTGNNICVEDWSSPGQTASPLVKRSILFGDGYADFSSNPTAQKTVCYAYSSSGKFPIVLEIIDTKGCYARAYDSVDITQNASATFTQTITNDCDTAKLCISNTSKLKRSQVSHFYWLFGDGSIDSSNWFPPCHTYSVPGTYTVSFVVRTGPKCVDTLVKTALIELSPAPIVKDIPLLSGCLGTSFSMADLGIGKDHYTWWIAPLGGKFDSISNNASTSFTPDAIGDYAIKLFIRKGACENTVFLDTIVVNGPEARIAARNNSLCLVGDSTYFCDASNYTNTKGVRRIWFFDDILAPSCTSDIANGVNVGMNCNYSVDQNPTHYYADEDCYRASLFLEDTITNCKDIAYRNVLIGREDPALTMLSVNVDKGCVGKDPSRTHYFSVNTCGDYLLNPDSAGSSGFIKNLDRHNYESLSSLDGFVTVGIILLGSDSASSCPGFTTGPACHDTIWFHQKIKLVDKPNPAFNVTAPHVCKDDTAQFILEDTSDTRIRQVFWNWGDGSFTTINLNPGQSLPSTYYHPYPKNGPFLVQVRLENDFGCTEIDTVKVTVGHQSQIKIPDAICAGNCVPFDETLLYYGDGYTYWSDSLRRASGLETVLWEWGDGTFDSIQSPYHCFPDPGAYSVKRTSTDSVGCVHTGNLIFNVGGVKAGIRQHKVSILCSEIIQLFDSSYIIKPQTGEKVIDYTWDFKDGSPLKKIKNPFHFYSAFGEFDIQLNVITDFGCTDSSYAHIEIIGPKPAFEFVTDTIGCVPLTVEMKNISTQCSNWIWYFGDLSNSTLPTKYDSNAVFTYQQPGTYTLRLYGADSIYNPATQNKQFCSATYPDLGVAGQIEKKVVVLPRPPVSFTIPAEVCVDEIFMINSTADPRYTKHVYAFGNGSSNSTFSRTLPHSYSTAGTYIIEYNPTYAPDPKYGKACYDSAVRTIDVIDILADFEIDSSISKPLDLQFINTSIGGVAYNWTFRGLDSTNFFLTSKDQDPFVKFYPNQGRYQVCLKARNKLGCEDEVCKTFYLTNPRHIFIPNVFTPGSIDGYNDAFDIDILGEEIYHLKIFNRFGQLVYQSETDGFGKDGINWDGADLNNYLLPAGVYYVIFDYKFYYEAPIKYTGTVTLMK